MIMEKVEAGTDPRKAEALFGTQEIKAVDSVTKEIDELKMKINQEYLVLDPAELKRLKTKLMNLKSKTLRRVMERSQQSHESRYANEKVDESEVGATEASLTASSWDMGCFEEDFDLYLWGQECNGQDLNE
ncbi:hypothetical protein H0H93_005106 [Arthromyces matolae]|nr:hypothetical protein H0H93_005106 [Arthromyces matolae]